MTIQWFTRQPGEVPMSEELDGSVALLLSDGPPDWVRLPPELGGASSRVLGAFTAPCVCEDSHTVRHLTVGDGLYVAECGANGFLWYEHARKEGPHEIQD